MTIGDALDRFDATMSAAWPTAFAALRPGASEHDLQRLRDAVAPFRLPVQLEALYRWRDGGDGGIFGGWHMRPIDDLITWYRFTVDELESPRTWLPVFDDQIVNIVTLDVPDQPPSDESVRYGHAHDVSLCRMFDSVEALLDVVCDASEAGALTGDETRVGLLDEYGVILALDERPWATFRQVRSPAGWAWPDPPLGTDLSRSPSPDWPLAWSAGLVTRDT